MASETPVLEDFFENNAFAFHIASSDGTILRANAAELELVGYSGEEYVGRPLVDFHADPAVIESILSALSRGEKVKRVQARLIRKDGSTRHVEITSSARFQDGVFVGTRTLTVDLTEDRRAQVERHWRSVLD